MRILHVTDHFPPVLGGIETHVAALAQRQAAAGHEVTVVTSQPEPSPVSGVQVVDGRGLADPAAYDVAHAHVSVVAPFTAPLTARLARAGLPSVVTVHSMWNATGPIAGWAARAAGLASAPVAWTAVSAVAARTVAQSLPRSAGRIAVLPNAVAVAPRQSTPALARPIDEGRPLRLVTTMRLARRKRPLAMLAMLERVHRELGAPVELTVIGDGPMRARIERTIERRSLAGVRLVGRVGPDDVTRLVAEADVYVAPARFESFGLAALEARCVGLPVVGFGCSGLTEFVHDGVEGLLAESDRGLAEQVVRLARDPDLLAAISEHNRSTASPFTWAAALDAHAAAYALAAGPRRAWRPTRPWIGVA